VNRVPVLVHGFQATGEWHAFLSRPFHLKPGPNRLLLVAGSVARPEGQGPGVLFEEISLVPD
jgi:hypothetical protein